MKRFSFMMLLLSAIGFVGCEENKTGDESLLKVEINVDRTEIVNDGTMAATFTVTMTDEMAQNVDVTSECRIYDSVTGDPLQGNTFTSTEVGEYTFYAMYNAAMSDNQVTIKVVEAPAQKQITVLTPSKSKIVADGVDAVTFTVSVDNTDVTSQAVICFADGKTLEGNTFTTTVAGEYEFYAYTATSEASARVTITAEQVAEEKPIELSASKREIRANGVDAVVFSVMQDGSNVTDDSTIYVNGSKLNGNRFATYSAGSYTVYATKGTKTSNEIEITATEVTESGTTVVFAEGVSLTSGWYDVNKLGDGTDINMCWAASSSNIIQWWQDRYVAAGNTLPAGCPNGVGARYDLAIMDVFFYEWDNSRGSHSFHAAPWYFEGKNVCEGWSGQAQPLESGSGGYFRDVWSEIESHLYMGYTVYAGYTDDFNNYYLWGKGSGLDGMSRLNKFSEYVITFMERGMISLAIAQREDFSGSHHAVTLWGYEVDNATGNLTKIWITDSDDCQLKGNGREPRIHEYSVSLTSGDTIVFSGDVYPACYPVSLYPISGYGSADR